MPPWFYLPMHPAARLTAAEKHDGILDRIAHRIEMRGDSMRKNRGKQPSA